MQVKVLYLGRMKELSSKTEENMDVPSGITLYDLNCQIRRRYPDMKKYIFRVAVNRNIEDENIELHENDEVALLPAFAGG
jgi:molybdopterin converting factor small subunit